MHEQTRQPAASQSFGCFCNFLMAATYCSAFASFISSALTMLGQAFGMASKSPSTKGRTSDLPQMGSSCSLPATFAAARVACGSTDATCCMHDAASDSP